MKLKKKCFFLQNTIKYLRFEINPDGVSPGKEKISAVIYFPVPKNIHEVRQFLGLTSFLRKFVQQCSLIARPVQNLLKKDGLSS